MDPQLTDDLSEKPKKYKNIARERYIISKHTNTSYEGTEHVTPVERGYILEFIMEDLQKQKDMYDKAKAERARK